MTHRVVYNMFFCAMQQLNFYRSMEHLHDQIDTWFPNGKSSIRIRFKDLREIIFTYNEYNNWSIETVDSYLKRISNNGGHT